jgi:hypothetical protein
MPRSARILLVVILLLSPLSILLVRTQTLTVAIPPNTPFTISFIHNLLDSAQFRFICDGGIVKNYTTSEILTGKSTTANADGTFTITVTAPGLASGTHSCSVSAFNTIGEIKSDPITIPIGNIPMKPGSVMVVSK